MFHKSEVDFTPVTEIADAKKGGKKGKAMPKGKSLKTPSDMKAIFPKETSVSAEKGNKAKKVSIPKQKLQ
jgi:hypothetical protein